MKFEDAFNDGMGILLCNIDSLMSPAQRAQYCKPAIFCIQDAEAKFDLSSSVIFPGSPLILLRSNLWDPLLWWLGKVEILVPFEAKIFNSKKKGEDENNEICYKIYIKKKRWKLKITWVVS